MSTEKSTIDRLVLPALPSARTNRVRPANASTASTHPATGAATPLPTGRLLRATFGLLERHAPRLGGRLAEHLWFRLPPRADGQTRARRTPAGGEPFDVAWGGGTVCGRVYGDWGNPTAYLVHGWGGWWQQLSALVPPLLEAGLCVVAVDGPSHGDSGPGRFGRSSTTFVELGEALRAVVGEFGRPTVVVAHSAGAMATMLAMQGEQVHPDSLVFLAPPRTVEPMVRAFAAALGAGERTLGAMVHRAEGRVGMAMDDIDLVAFAAAHRALPRLLVIHDRSDAEAPVSGAVELTTAWHDARLQLTDGLGHRRVMWDPAVVRRVTAFAAEAAERVRRSSR